MKKLTLVLPTLALALSLTLSPQSFASFTDVPASHPNYEAINYVQAEGIVEGYPDGTYQADKQIDRYEFTKIIVGAVYSKEEIEACKTSPFPDVPMDWFTPYVCLAQKTGIVSGYPDGTFQGTNQIKFVEAAKIIVNGFKYPVQQDAVTWYKPYILKLEELKALPTSLTGFEHLVKRGEMAEVIHRLHAKITNKPSTTYANLELVTVPEGASQQEISEKAVNYHNALVALRRNFKEAYDKYTLYIDTTENSDVDAADVERKNAIAEIIKVKAQMETVLSFLGDQTLKNAFISNINASIQLLNEEHKELLELLKTMSQSQDDLTPDDIVKVKEIIEIINQKLNESDQKLLAVQQTFADKFNFKILTSDLSLESSAALDHYNKVIELKMVGVDGVNAYNELTVNTPATGDNNMLDSKRIEVINQIKKSQTEILAMDGVNGDFSLRDGANNYLNSLLSALENEEKQLIDLRIKISNAGGVLTQEDLNKANELELSLEEKYKNADETFNFIHQSFVQRYGLSEIVK